MPLYGNAEERPAFVNSCSMRGMAHCLLKKPAFVSTGIFPPLKSTGFSTMCLTQKVAQSGRACFGTVDSWLIFNLTKGRRHVTDVSNAARTMLYNIHTLSWDEVLAMAPVNIPRSMLPEVVNTAGAIGYTDPSLFDAEIPITAAAGDQQAALFGQGCFNAGMFKTTYGTGCFMLLNTGDAPCTAQNGLLSTIAWKIGEKITYAAEGSVFIAGAAIQWLRDELGLISTSEQSETEAVKVPNTGGVYLVPAFSGLGAPYWVP